jgi:hypothetical protein
MNGCRYCVIMHHRKRHGKKRARGVAMCLAQAELTRCEKRADERGPGCEFHDAKIVAANQPALEPPPSFVYIRANASRKNLSPPAALEAHVLY